MGADGLAARRLQTRFGPLLVEASAAGLYGITLPVEGMPMREEGTAGNKDALAWLDAAARRLAAYFERGEAGFGDLCLDLSGYSAFETRVLRALAATSPGELVSYQALGARAGFPGSARAVGQVMNKNRIPVVIPCHRVIKSDGGIGGFACGLEWKRRLLSIEGARLELWDEAPVTRRPE